MTDVSLFRLYLLRAMYLFMAAGLALTIWPGIIHHDQPWSLMHGVACCLLGAAGVMAVLGIRYPLRMLPLFFFEIVWKSIWLIAVAWPLWSAGRMDADTQESVFACAMAILFPIVIPWRYVWANYVTGPGDRWR
jgi:hypothetical protein